MPKFAGLDKLHHLSELQFPHLKNKANNRRPRIGKLNEIVNVKAVPGLCHPISIPFIRTYLFYYKPGSDLH